MVIMHKCDNPACCNPDHLVAGSQKDNLDDMRSKGREGDCRVFGEMHGRCKASSMVVGVIRNRYALGNVSQQQLANEFGLSQTQVGRIVRHENRTVR